MASPLPSSTPLPLAGRVALITGASQGIGAAVAKRYAAEGAHVILVGRNVKGLEETDDAIQTAGGQATLVPLDLMDGKKIDELGSVIAKRWGKLDILVANAGVLGKLMPVSHITPDIWEKVIATNLTSNWRLIRSLDPLLRASDAGRALFVTSGITQGNFAFWGAYAASKAGLEALIGSYAEEVKGTKLQVSLIDPGIVRTKMRAAAMPGEDPLTLPEPSSITDVFVEAALPSFQGNGQRLDV
ncbi:MAG: Oxidoreductase, short-chain dehydrogenase/reductase family [Rickettsiales bacterium]|jgi:NAD(P)-dependent dehydrogenase (short-subunit alcohol dehydrogenase family)|nr:Oxidoreductase, short-chain dehydrogenase/reductase family [Rickettsiales bacterium]